MPTLAISLTLSHFIVYTPDNWEVWFFNTGPFFAPCFCNFLINFVCFQPTFVKGLLLCLKAVHQSQSLYLLRILTESFLDSSHQSVVRMTERIIRRRLEMYSSGQKRVILYFLQQPYLSLNVLITFRPEQLFMRSMFAFKNHILLAVKVVI